MELADTLFVKKLHDSGVQLSDADIAAFERELGARLPEDYRQLLLFKNGGRFYYDHLVCPFPGPNEYVSDFGLSIVFSLLEPPDDNTNDLRNMRDMHRDRLPSGTLAVADDGDNLLLIDLRPEAHGAVYFWVRDNEAGEDDEEGREANRIPVAPSLTAMAERFRPVGREFYTTIEEFEPFRAIAFFDLDRLRALLDAGLDPDTTNERGVPLLAFACDELNYDAAELLLARGANPNEPTARGKSALKSAAEAGAIDLMRLLLEHGAHRHMPGDPSVRIVDALYPPPRRRVRELLTS